MDKRRSRYLQVKHVGLKYSYVKGAVQTKQTVVQYKTFPENKADSLTKELLDALFQQHREYLHFKQGSSREACRSRTIRYRDVPCQLSHHIYGCLIFSTTTIF